uniref:Uncharacterized protein n=1 Tax=Aplanochytrium stocchinoi TaxID=215587 RepID=A0A7S3LIG8_9STRA|mmetsp:Transcript_545/g.648  ORF Transcript_545/g.648 Transcript_545/m.648 type:complete len:172 (-) Transcript_545:221-736(-)|eukprot:CAMPEP_0204827778 /NCGR_PEP_ID=MMETSP1346-20131115/5247_1 /ASSEMBLY_ACC=CAM_ASM_000771 /TAXON_ID=215587 /ORGANISM="Aplanochytrium stocchinoi, Strain GSBS06" /LENGTH=171 /DNA_ID=CAMNT_0051956353 /DNA_START=350 /DNA_END=865 /DNA_ORIENTATION=-
MSELEKRTPEDIKRLVELYTTESFLDFISEEIENPFRATSNARLVKLLDSIFMKDPTKKLKLSDFEISGEPDSLHQLPNLLKTYIIQSDYEFGTDKEVDRKFAYIIFRVLEGCGNNFRSFKAFALAFNKARRLHKEVEKIERHFERLEKEQETREMQQTEENKVDNQQEKV